MCEDLIYDLSVSLEDAYKGKKQEINFSSTETCKRCSGHCSEPGSKPISCSMCGGQGRVRSNQGFFTIQQTCHECSGEGEKIDNHCKNCGGGGKTQSNITYMPMRFTLFYTFIFLYWSILIFGPFIK